MIDISTIAWEKQGGLIPAVVQDARDGTVLMLGYMNEAALVQTQESRLVTFYSRSKQRLWTKGESSGHHLQLQDLRLDCDGDTLLVQAIPQGPTCHTGTNTCWGAAPESTLGFLNQLDQLLDTRYIQRPEGSYTSKLFASGVQRMAQKVGEEGVEVALAALASPEDEFLGEAADLLFHLMVLLRAKNLHLSDVVQVLRARHKPH